MKNDPIYVITMMRSKDYFEKFQSRVVGFYHEKQNAEEAVLANSLDIYECEFDLSVIEETEPGEYALSTDRWFYTYDPITEKYFPIEEPDEFKQVINLGIG
jgi:hypothetical protein